MALTTIVIVLTVLLVEALKAFVPKVKDLSATNKQLLAVLVTTVLTLAGKSFDPSLPIEGLLSLLTPDLIKEILFASLAAMGLYTVGPKKLQ